LNSSYVHLKWLFGTGALMIGSYARVTWVGVEAAFILNFILPSPDDVNFSDDVLFVF